MNILDVLNKGRVVELNKVLEPGKEQRRLEIRPYRVLAGEFMHDVDTMSHIGTHAEAPSHFLPALEEPQEGADIAAYPPEAWWGEAVFVDLAVLPAKGKVTVDFVKEHGVKAGDIVLMGNAKHEGDDKISMTDEAARYLAETGIKLLAMDFSYNIEERFDTLENMKVHLELMGRNIPLIEGLAHLDELKERRCFFLGLPYRVKGCDAWPVRALAIEGVL
jgi:kynurenine formamidase